MKIVGGQVFNRIKGFENRNLYIQDGKIISESLYEAGQIVEECIDVAGCYVIPGLIDIHLHGCKKVDTCDANLEALDVMTAYEASQGVTAICPTTMSLPQERLLEIMSCLGNYRNEKGAMIVGINMEGPYISYEKKGAQNGNYIRKASVSEFKALQEAAKHQIKLIDIAPEVEGALAFIEQMKDEVVISLAHSTATYEQTREALRKGASHITHLYNAMTGFQHRAPGMVGAAAEDESCYVELICDGIHVHPSVVRSTFKLMGAHRIVWISDSMEATGMPDGRYALGGQEVTVQGAHAFLEDGTIAGSATNLMGCFKVAVQQMGIPLEQAIVCASENPARSIGVFEEMGSLEEGKWANIVILDKKLEVKQVLIKGKVVRQ